MSKEIITELEVLFTANTQKVDKAARDVQTQAQKIERTPVKQRVDGDAKNALDAMDRVEAEAKKIVSAKTLATVDANITKAEKNLTVVQERLDYLRSIEATMEVTADIKRAETALKQIQRRRDGLVSARESMVIDADTAPAEAALKDLQGKAGDAGDKAGDDAGEGLSAGIIAAIATIPIAGAIVGIGAAIGKSLMDGLQVEVRSDRLMATTGLDPDTVGKLARAAGEAYADNWGESLEANMDTARLAIQNGLLDPAATARDSQKIIESLSGIADIMGGDISRTSQAAATIIRSGLAKDAAGAFDIIVRGFQVGNDKAEDWLDTLIEYPSVLTKLGISGAEATGLINQGLKAGARNSDVVADALKEFQIRATDASTASADGYRRIGLSAQEMTAKIAAGGDGAREGLAQVLDGLRAMEDPVARNAAAVELFGTKAEDLGDALFALDLSSAVDELGAFSGAAQTALGTLSDNAASDIASAQRNIEVAADGIKGALAAAFNPQIEDFATFVSENRAQVMGFLLDLANGGLDAGRAIVNGIAGATEAVGAFIAGPIAQLLDALANAAVAADAALLGDQHSQEFRKWADDAIAGMKGFEDSTKNAADTMRTQLIENGIDPAQEKLNEVAIPLIAQARVHDASVRLASDIDSVGYAADGSKVAISLLSGELDTSTEAGRLLDEQMRGVVAGLDAQIRAGVEAGDAQADLTSRYDEGREALIRQLEQMGLTTEQATALAEQYGAIPGRVETVITADASQARAEAQALWDSYGGKTLKVYIDAQVRGGGGTGVMLRQAAGHIVSAVPMGTGGIPGTPMEPLAQVVPPNTWRVVGDRPDVRESYIPLDGSARSWALLFESFRLMPGAMPMADGAVVGSPLGRGPAGPPVASAAYFTDQQVERLAQAVERRSAGSAAMAVRQALDVGYRGGGF